MEAKKSKLPYLPDDVIKEILLRSPVKSVGRFRCVSKFFCSLLSDPKFARMQLELTLGRSNVVGTNNRRLIMASQNLFLLDLDSIDVERQYSFRECLILLSKLTQKPKFQNWISFLSDPGMNNGWLIDIMGSSNGLVCLRFPLIFRDEEEQILLYNPTTRDSKLIPELPESVHCKPHQHHPWFCRYGFGFGFDALTNDYKVVKLVSCKDRQNTVCYVYSLKSDSWKKINSLLPCLHEFYVSSENFEGAIHWMGITAEVEFQTVLMAFDLEKEEMREMSLPNWAEEFDSDLRFFAVDTFKGCLCVVHGCFQMHNVIWVMKEYGVESSWIKIRFSVSEFSIKPLCLTKNNKDVLQVFDGDFVYSKLENPGEKFYMKIKASTYVESLISPNSFGEQR